MTLDPDEKTEKIAGIIARYRSGQLSEPVFTASLKAAGMRRDNIDALVSQHRAAHIDSIPFRRGELGRG